MVLLVADGLTPEGLDAAIRDGDVPELAALGAGFGRHVATTVFPSVTGVAYVPLLTGMHPADAGIPGLRWYDRTRQLPACLGHSRSYVGAQIRAINRDLSPAAITAFERSGGNALGMEAMITRGLPRRNRLDRGTGYSARVIHAHLTGDVDRWTALEEELAERLVTRVRRERPRFVFAAFTSGDKAAHRGGVHSSGVRRSLQLVDHVARSIRVDAERDGRWKQMHLWIASDHGHHPVHSHLDLAAGFRLAGLRVRSHPWTLPDRSDAAVMVSGNSMAHVYLGLEAHQRMPWPALRDSWLSRLGGLWAHPAVDLIATKRTDSIVDVWKGEAQAEVSVTARGLSYRTVGGNPLEIEPFEAQCSEAAHERTLQSPYPDSVEQLARIVLANRSGDLVISAAPGWDLRRAYEPINHVSSHGALHAAHMLVPLVGNRRPEIRLRRTTDVFALVARALDSWRRSSEGA